MVFKQNHFVLSLTFYFKQFLHIPTQNKFISLTSGLNLLNETHIMNPLFQMKSHVFEMEWKIAFEIQCTLFQQVFSVSKK